MWAWFERATVAESQVALLETDRRLSEIVIETVRLWVQRLVVDLNLCPFAKRELVKNRVRFVVSDAQSEEQLLLALQTELERLERDASIETTLLIHPHVLQHFYDYNQFLDSADRLLVQMQLDGVCQIASFHPQYQFAGTAPDDAENYSNRSPHPLLHLLREDSLERAIAGYPDVEQIPIRNIALMNATGKQAMQILLESCLIDAKIPAGPDATPARTECPWAITDHNTGANQ